MEKEPLREPCPVEFIVQPSLNGAPPPLAEPQLMMELFSNVSLTNIIESALFAFKIPMSAMIMRSIRPYNWFFFMPYHHPHRLGNHPHLHNPNLRTSYTAPDIAACFGV